MRPPTAARSLRAPVLSGSEVPFGPMVFIHTIPIDVKTVRLISKPGNHAKPVNRSLSHVRRGIDTDHLHVLTAIRKCVDVLENVHIVSTAHRSTPFRCCRRRSAKARIARLTLDADAYCATRFQRAEGPAEVEIVDYH
jgi:hypothetical protein